MYGLIIDRQCSLIKPFPKGLLGGERGEALDQSDQLQQHVKIKVTCRGFTIAFGRQRAPVSPFTVKAAAATLRVRWDQRVDACDSSRLQDWRSLTFERMKWMTDLHPTQRLVGCMCSSHGLSRFVAASFLPLV